MTLLKDIVMWFVLRVAQSYRDTMDNYWDAGN